jgi:hypothetical protein
VPIFLKNPHHPISHAFAEITKELVKFINASKIKYQASTKSEKTEILKKSSKLG